MMRMVGSGISASYSGTCREQLILYLGLVKPLLFAAFAEFADFRNRKKPQYFQQLRGAG
jgi:hypothetical protein